MTCLEVRELLPEHAIGVLGELEQFTLNEIADALGINPSTASTRLRAARREFERAAQRHHRRDTWKVGCSQAGPKARAE